MRWPSTWITAWGPPPLGDKLVDWQLLAAAGGQPALYQKDVLELGPGFGIDVLMHSHIVKSYTLLDISPNICADMLRWRDIMRTSIRVVQGDAKQLPFANATFDVVIDFSTIDNVAGDPFDAFREVVRVLRAEGLFICTFASAAHMPVTGGVNNEHAFYSDALAAFFDGLGFDVLTYDGSRAGLIAKKRKLR